MTPHGPCVFVYYKPNSIRQEPSSLSTKPQAIAQGRTRARQPQKLRKNPHTISCLHNKKTTVIPFSHRFFSDCW